MINPESSRPINDDQLHATDEPRTCNGDVVVIDENPLIRMLLGETLFEIGFTSVGFANADAAMQHLLDVQGHCLLIIADQGIFNPSDALDFIKMAKNEWPLIPAILTSGHLIEPHLIPPFSTYLRKPYSLDQLENSVLVALSTSGNNSHITNASQCRKALPLSESLPTARITSIPCVARRCVRVCSLDRMLVPY